ncbi:AI-2E family transporter [Arenibacter certesii]|uniref:AI-2E family transporter n=1 Tax=Arenibacter certesii TaxID=228955 RepID=A0A918MGB7_9FLAO|nr:AI-2E family transporter [Arenibacter certesii]GGW22158.1 AI-2E family transporter [Arenibacter certesii]
MKSKTIANGILRAVGVITAIVLLAYFLYQIQSVIAYILIAAVVALIGRPVVFFLKRRLKFPNILAVTVTLLLIIGIFAAIVALFIPVITQQGKNLALLDFDELLNSLNSVYNDAIHYFGGQGGGNEEVIKKTDIGRNIKEELQTGLIPNFLNAFMTLFSDISIGLFSVLFISFFFLKDSNLLQNGLLILVPQSKEEKLVNSMEKIKNLLSRYFVGLLVQIFILFSIYSILLLLIGLENAIIIAFFCAIFNIIPYLGPIIGGGLMIALTITSNMDANFVNEILPKTGYVLIGLTIGQLVDNFFSQPIIFSNSVKSHPLEIFLVIIIAGLLFGITGMIIAVPGYTAIKVILKEFLSENKIVKFMTKDL